MGEPRVRLLLDPDDDAAIGASVRGRTDIQAGRLCIEAGPAMRTDRGFAAAVMDALGDPVIRWMPSVPYQLDLLPPPGPPEVPWQLHLPLVFPTPPGWEERRRRWLRPWVELRQTAEPLADAGIRHLYVLRAHTLPPARWAALRVLSARARLTLWLVVHGRPPSSAQLGALGDEPPLRRVLRRSSPAPPRSTPTHSARPLTREDLPRLKAAGAALLREAEDAGCRSFLLPREPRPQPIPLDRLAAAFRAVLQRCGAGNADDDVGAA